MTTYPSIELVSQLVVAQDKLRDLCFAIAADDDINTFHSKLVYNDGIDAEYEFLNEDSVIYAVELERADVGKAEAYECTVKRLLPETDESPRRLWEIVSSSLLRAES